MTPRTEVASPPGHTPQAAERGPMLRFLLGPPGDPRWARPALCAVLALAALLYVWNLGAVGDANSYYAAAILSGTKSWKAFFFGSLDAGSFITVDKPPVALWVMGLSARIFGYSTWSMMLPQAAAGVAAVGVVAAMVRRAFTGVLGASGAIVAGLVAALVMALTPITVAINRDNNPDTVLVLLLVLAAWALQRAMERDRLRWLVASAVLVGFAFNTKMLQAFLVLPAFTLVYLLCARAGFWRRVGQLAVAGVALAVSAGWWMVVVDLIPAGQRPFIGSSSKNSVWDLVIGYNGLGRVLGGDGNGGAGRFMGGGGAAAREAGRQFGIGGSFGGGGGFGGTSGAGRLFNDTIGGQISWLIPFAVLAVVVGLVLLWGRFGARAMRGQSATAALLLWGGWLAVHYVVFSFSQGTFHPYYTTTMAPAIAALTGAGGVMLLRASGRRWSWALPVGLIGSGIWAFVLLRRTASWHPWLAWTVLVVTLAAGVTLLTVRLKSAGQAQSLPLRRITVVAAVAGLVGVLAGPAAYAITPLSSAGGGMGGSNPLAGPSSSDPGGPGMARRFRSGFPAGLPNGPLPGSQGFAGPGFADQSTPAQGAPGQGRPGGGASGQSGPGGGASGQSGPGGGASGQGAVGGGTAGQGAAGQGVAGAGVSGMPVPGGGGPGGEVSPTLINYLDRNRGTATWLVAVSSAQSAAAIILRTWQPVIAMGGFSGRDPAMSVDKLKGYIASGKLRYVMVGGDRRGPDSGNSTVTHWVTQNCTAVTPSDYGATASSGDLYRCS